MFTELHVIEALEHLRKNPRRTFVGELTLASVLSDPKRWARALCATLNAGRFVAEPAVPRQVHLEGKTRTLYRSTLLDAIVERMLSRWLTARVEPHLSPHVHSYRQGRSGFDAVDRFSGVLRAHRDATPNPLSRGLFVMRRDIRAYGESIPVGASSPLWLQLEAMLDRDPAWPIAEPLLRAFLARRFVREDGSIATLEIGTPTGSSLQPIVNNLYLGALDAALTHDEDFYARFGDDVLFATASIERAQRAAQRSVQILADLGLCWKDSKSQDRWFTGAARPHDTHPSWAPTARIDWLGMSINFDGMRAMRTDKWRALLRKLDARLRNTHRLTRGLPQEERVRALVSTLNLALDLRAVTRTSHTEGLAYISDRAQLRELDHLLALRVAEVHSHRRGVRALRELSPRSLREVGYVSVVLRHDETRRRTPRGEP